MNMESVLFQPLSKGAISEILIERIVEAIEQGHLQPGDKIPTEVEFSDKLGVGRNAVREAIKVLVAFGLLEIRRSDGTYVVERHAQNLINPTVFKLVAARQSAQDHFEYRASILHSAIRLAQARTEPKDIQYLSSVCRTIEDTLRNRPVDINKVYTACVAFETGLCKTTRNTLLEKFYESAEKLYRTMYMKGIKMIIEKGDTYVILNQFLPLMRALRDNDLNQAHKAVDESLQTLVGYCKRELWVSC